MVWNTPAPAMVFRCCRSCGSERETIPPVSASSTSADRPQIHESPRCNLREFRGILPRAKCGAFRADSGLLVSGLSVCHVQGANPYADSETRALSLSDSTVALPLRNTRALAILANDDCRAHLRDIVGDDDPVCHLAMEIGLAHHCGPAAVEVF